MILENIEIDGPEGRIDCHVARPSTSEALPAVIHLTDIFGIRPASTDLAERIAEGGYVVLTPNIFYRSGRPPVFGFEPDFGTERTMNRFKELASPLTPEAMRSDGAAFVDFLSLQPYTSAGPMGVVGFCFSGKFALRIAAERPDRIAVAASFHGGGLVTEDENSPHLVLSQIKARLYFGHADSDRSMPAEAIEKLDRALALWGGSFESELYAGAQHGWMLAGRDAHHPEQAKRGFAKLMALLDGTLMTPLAV